MLYQDRAHRVRGFRIHAVVFVLCMIGLAITNAFTGPPYWIGWVLLGWGTGIAAHWLFALRLAPK